MSNIQILVIGRHAEITSTIIRLINNKPDWKCTGVLTDEEAIAAFDEKSFNAVLIGAGVTPQEKQQLCDIFHAKKPGIPVIQHYGGGSGLLFAEIYQALGIS
ncbi:hypothetical protein [Mucilaginibacter paludis]|uniref:Response regulator receiver protein n=1 Tax=Mucilaginibacter paludis DSM 18603 TaxID=714943 RepID=H1YFN7_9SPHI|nr:hypothetical protein [Mucilaginibacter paludis]EHQ24439.1 hypothetical protein Mucpa_0240 [Mucilaginibacter paludis DSM 18603]